MNLLAHITEKSKVEVAFSLAGPVGFNDVLASLFSSFLCVISIFENKMEIMATGWWIAEASGCLKIALPLSFNMVEVPGWPYGLPCK